MSSTAAHIQVNTPEWLEARKDYIGASEMAALFNASPYLSKYLLWHQKKGNYQGQQENDAMFWGKQLEDSIAEGIAKREGWTVEKNMHWVTHSGGIRMAASVDYWCVHPEFGRIPMEIKYVGYSVFKSKWIDAGEDSQAPVDIELQLQSQLECVGSPAGIIAAFHGHGHVAFVRQRHQGVIDRIIPAVNEFWQSIEDDQEPDPSSPDDYQMITKVYAEVQKEVILDYRHDKDLDALARTMAMARQEKSEREATAKGAAAMIIKRMGTAGTVQTASFTLSRSKDGKLLVKER